MLDAVLSSSYNISNNLLVDTPLLLSSIRLFSDNFFFFFLYTLQFVIIFLKVIDFQFSFSGISFNNSLFNASICS